MSDRISKRIFKNEKTSVLIIILVASSAVMGFGFLFYFSPKPINNSYEIFGNDPSISNVEIYNDIQMGDIEINLLKDNTNIFAANWSYNALIGYGPANDIVSYRKIGNTIKIYLKFKLDQDVTDLKFNVYINPNYKNYALMSDNKLANLKMKFESMNFSNFYVKTTSGDIDITLDYIGFYNDLSLESVSGQIYMNCWELYFLNNGNFKILTDISHINVDWVQHVKIDHNVNVSFTSNNYAELEYWVPYEVNRFNVSFESIGGTRRFSREPMNFIEVETDHYHSLNINDTSIDFLTINMYSTDGYLWIYLKDCFKPQRYCDQSMPQFPWDVQTDGTYTISDSKYEISSVIINNHTNYNIDFDVLPGDSDFTLIVNWSLIYQQGPDLGLGFIEIGISEKLEGDILVLDIQPIYEKDRIRPIFTGGFLSVSIHPDY